MMNALRGIDPASGRMLEIRLQNGTIEAIDEIGPNAGSGPSRGQEQGLPYLSHGFFDIQVNGYNGSDYSAEDLDAGHIQRIMQSLAAAGTTQHLATIVTRPRGRIVENLRIIARSRRESQRIQAAISGIHLEGPFISAEEGPRGAHDLASIRDPDFDEFLEWQEAAEGLIRIVTLAPEKKGALEFIQKLTAAGVIAAIGHTAAPSELISEAVAAGCRLSTHLGNGSHATLPRLRNYVWEQLAADSLYASIISDSFHLPPAVVKTIARAKGMDRLILVSDVSQPGGYKPGLYRWGALEVRVFDDGHVGLSGSSFLAGAGHLLDWDIPHFMRFTGASLSETIRLCTRNPAGFIPASGLSGILRVGENANIVLFRYGEDDERLRIASTFIEGEEVFKSSQP
ncbi:MAG: N-acetylglucosamine-6-phosphate deacetylase [Spirochaetae bacterium HGW-Spirochaetae-9]|nr:MAG: N-acetylglucosamine-6-phosphate deacetylase [Spirochaetae bacterium HGW-Spirochaetae-9]